MADRTHDVEKDLTQAAEDRSREAPPRAEGERQPASPDEFVSSEVAAKTSVPHHDPKTTS